MQSKISNDIVQMDEVTNLAKINKNFKKMDGVFKSQTYDQKVSEVKENNPLLRGAQIIECGGSGDCFFRCFHTLSSLYENEGAFFLNLSIEDFYAALDLPMFTWIEDTHINQLAISMFCKICIFSYIGEQMYMSQFGVSGPTYYMENIGNYHYRAVISPAILEEVNMVAQMGFNFESQLRVLKENSEIRLPLSKPVEEEPEVQDWDPEEEADEQEFSEESDEEIVDHSDFSVLPPGCSAETLFSYLRDFGSMSCDNGAQVLDAFVIVHNSILDWICDNLNSGSVSHPYVLKLYYKCRHNTFGFLCTDNLGKRNLETDVSLSKYIDSQRTPDLVIESETNIELVEFTVSNKYDMVDFNKGGGILDVKYTKEAGLISEKTGKACRVRIVPAVLDEFNIEEIAELMSGISSVNRKLMTRFFAISNKSKNIISNAYFSGYNSNLGVPGAAGDNEIPALNSTEMLDGHFVSIILKNWSWLSNYVAGSIDRRGPDTYVAFVYEKSDGRIRMIEKPNKMKMLRLGECYHILEEGDLSKVLKFMNYKLDGKNISTKEMRGDVAITTPNTGLSFKKNKWNHSTTTKDYYSRSTPATKDPYGEFDTLPAREANPPRVKVKFNEGYFNKLLNHPFQELKDSSSSAFLANNILSPEYLEQSVNTFKEEYEDVNNNASLKFNPKQTFLLPMVTVPCQNTDLDNMSLNVIQAYLASGKGKYTQMILNKASAGMFYNVAIDNELIVQAREKYSASRSNYTNLYKKQVGGLQKWSATAQQDKVVLNNPRSRMVRCQQEYISLLRKAKQRKTRTIKLNCGKNSVLKRDFQNEMNHFQKHNKGLKGVGPIHNFEALDSYFKNFASLVCETGFQKLDLPALYNRERGPGPKFLTDDKDYYTSRWDTFYNELFAGTMLEQLSVIGSNFSKLLFNESVKSYNQNYCRIDNLGFKQLVVIVRGGKKAYSGNMSKLFRVGFECKDEDLKYLGYEENEFFEIIRMEKKCFVYTPWSQIHIDTLYDWFSMRQRVFLNCYSNYIREGGNGSMSQLAVFPSLLSFHNRRKTESLLHNVRYLIVNPLGKFSNLKGIMKTFATFNLSYLDAWIKECIKHRYLSFSKRIHETSKGLRTNLTQVLENSGLKDLWFEKPFVTADQLTNFIYITYAMTKAPVNASLEQASNLKSILKDVQEYTDIHGKVAKMRDDSLHFNIFNFDTSVMDDDFKYDPEYCQFLGYHLAGFLRTRADPNEISGLWNRVGKKGLSSIANSNGLRGYKPENFYGKKGYEVVYDYIIKTLEEGDIKLDELVKQYVELDPDSAHEMIKSQILTKEELTLDKITFHIVHKLQRGGGREIFCMDLVTKAHQNPLEQFFKGLCKLVPNEFISISSAKRHSIIHTDFFERTPAPWVKSVLRWVLDCRRWAPHSVFQKYMHFIHGMSPILPKEMVDEFARFGDLMMEKRYITRQHVYSAIEHNMSFSELKKLLSPSKEAGTYETTVKFSFVMGIFNYLSSLMHSANQLLVSEVIMYNSLKSGTGLVIMDPKCHSDDSAITSYHENPESHRPSVLIYDWLLKGANHMLSIKKSQVNTNLYMEFLSILYIFDRYVPVIPKFVSSIPFKPTDQGYSADVTFAITQAIEILMQGGTIEESFLILKLTESHIQSIYNLTPNPNLPYNYLGNLDSHPVELLLSGANCEVYKFMKYKPLEFWAATNMLEDMELIDPTSPTDLSVKWDMGSRMSHRLRAKYSKYAVTATKLSQKYPWTLENCKLGNDYLNILWFVNKLNDPKYYASLIQEPESRRFTRAFGSFKYRNVISSSGSLVEVEKLSNLLANVDIYAEHIQADRKEALSEIFDFVCDDLGSFYQAIESGKWAGDAIPNAYKDKPVYFNFSLPQLSNVRIDANEYISYIREPEAYKLLGRRTDPKRQVSMISDYCLSLGLKVEKYTDSQLYMVVNKILNAGEHNFRLIAPIPSNNKKIDTFNALLSYMSNNSVRYKSRPIVSVSTSRVDWRRRVVSGKVPQVVMETLEMQNVIDIARNFEVEQYDIFNYNLTERLAELQKETPVSWRPLLYASLSDHDTPLVNENYWVYWERDQVKSGKEWFGKGSSILALPEVMMRLVVNNGMITEVEVDCESSISFNTTTNWFLSNILRMSGMNLPLDLAQYQDPNKLVLGYNSRSCVYGIDYPNRFDLVFPHPVITKEVAKSFMYVNCDREKRGRCWLYNDGCNTHKIEFFIPTVETQSIDISKYVEPTKVKKLLLDDKIRNFCFKLSVEIRDEFTYKTQEVIDTIGFSTLYKVLYSNIDFVNLFHGQTAQDVFLESIVDWRRHHNEFDFPTNDELAMLAKRSDLPQMPGKIIRYLQRMGMSTMSDEDYSSFISLLFNTPEDNRVNYLLSMLPQLSEGEQMNAIVITTRSDRIYDCVSLIGRDTFRILNPVLELIVGVVEIGNVNSPTLSSLTVRFSKNSPNDAYTLRLIIARIIITGYSCLECLSESDPTVGFFMSILSELIDDDLLPSLEVASASIPVLNTVKLNVTKEKFLDFMMNLFDGLYISRWSRKPIYAKSDLIRSEDANLSQHQKYMLKLLSWRMPTNINVKFKSAGKSTKVRLNLKSGKPGFAGGPFKPLDEDDQDEFESGYDWNPDIAEDLMFGDVGTAMQMAFVRVVGGNWVGVQSVRGTAHTIFVGTNLCCRDFFEAHGEKAIYRKNSFSNILDYINNISYYIIKVNESKKAFHIEGFDRIDYTEYFRAECNVKSPQVTLDGETYGKLHCIKTPSIARNIVQISSYFRRLTVDTADKELKSIKERDEMLEEIGVVRSENYKSMRQEIEQMIEKEKERKSEKVPLEASVHKEKSGTKKGRSMIEIMESPDFLGKLDNLVQTGGDDITMPSVQRQQTLDRNFNFKEPMKMLRDPDFIGEFNALFNNCWGQFERNELRMTALSKRTKIKYARMQVKLMPPQMQSHYAKIYGILLCLLNDIDTCESVAHESHELCAAIDQLFDVQTEADENVELSYMLQPSSGEIRKNPDLDKIFGK